MEKTLKLIEEMDTCRNFCSMIHKARHDAGFMSLKYPVTDVKVSRYFTPEFRDIIAEECNIVGYMDIPPVEYEHYPPEGYMVVSSGDDWVAVSTVRSGWQDELFEERSLKREESLKKKDGIRK